MIKLKKTNDTHHYTQPTLVNHSSAATSGVYTFPLYGGQHIWAFKKYSKRFHYFGDLRKKKKEKNIEIFQKALLLL